MLLSKVDRQVGMISFDLDVNVAQSISNTSSIVTNSINTRQAKEDETRCQITFHVSRA